MKNIALVTAKFSRSYERNQVLKWQAICLEQKIIKKLCDGRKIFVGTRDPVPKFPTSCHEQFIKKHGATTVKTQPH